jgi:RecA/RadA recombinase
MSDIEKILDSINELNPQAEYLSENTLSNVSEWIDTGCMALNAIISGSLYGGVPKGRITGFSGPSMTGKTLQVNKVLANAQKKGMQPVIFDSENAVDSASGEGVGLDTKKVKWVPVETVESCRNQLCAFLQKVIETPSAHGKFIISIDSLGNLSTEKEMKDASNGGTGMDMGLKAKSLKSMLRVLTHMAAKSNTTILFTNHIYDNPGEMYPSLVKTQAGGKGAIYLASVLLQLASKNEKQDDKREGDIILPGAKNISGATLRAMTVKNRFIPPFLECEMYLNFKTGLDRMSGILDLAVGNGVIINTGSTYTKADGTKLGYYKNWKDDTKLWDEYIFPNLEKKLNENYRYGAVQQEAPDDEVNEVD